MAALKKLILTLDANGSEVGGPTVPTFVMSNLLAASVAESIAVPAGAKFVLFSATGDFYAKYDGTATVPGDSTDGTSSELNPVTRDISGVTTISIISAATPIVTMAFYS